MVLIPTSTASSKTLEHWHANGDDHRSIWSFTRDSPPPPPYPASSSSTEDLATMGHPNGDAHEHHHGRWSRGHGVNSCRRFGGRHGLRHGHGEGSGHGRCGRSRDMKRRLFRRVLARFLTMFSLVMLYLHFDQVIQAVRTVQACLPAPIATMFNGLGYALSLPFAVSQMFGVVLYCALAASAVTMLHVKLHQRRRMLWHSRWTEQARVHHATLHDREAWPGEHRGAEHDNHHRQHSRGPFDPHGPLHGPLHGPFDPHGPPRGPFDPHGPPPPPPGPHGPHHSHHHDHHHRHHEHGAPSGWSHPPPGSPPHGPHFDGKAPDAEQECLLSSPSSEIDDDDEKSVASH